MTEFDAIYESMIGIRHNRSKIPWVENAFEKGSFCSDAHFEVYDAYERLRDRLGVIDDDEDVLTIISSLLDIQRELCLRMFQYGREYDQHEIEGFDFIRMRYTFRGELG